MPDEKLPAEKLLRIRSIETCEQTLEMLRSGATMDLKTEAEINKESACALLALVCAMVGGGA